MLYKTITKGNFRRMIEGLMEDNDVFGDAVNVAARMVALAKQRQIITTQENTATLYYVPLNPLFHFFQRFLDPGFAQAPEWRDLKRDYRLK